MPQHSSLGMACEGKQKKECLLQARTLLRHVGSDVMSNTVENQQKIEDGLALFLRYLWEKPHPMGNG